VGQGYPYEKGFDEGGGAKKGKHQKKKKNKKKKPWKWIREVVEKKEEEKVERGKVQVAARWNIKKGVYGGEAEAVVPNVRLNGIGKKEKEK